MVTPDADDKSRRLFLPVKNNLAPLGNGLAFRLEQRIVGPADKCIVASAVGWETSPVTVSADEALRAADDATDTERHAIDEATDFLRDKLSAGPVPVREVEEHGRALGLAKRTLDRARRTLRVQTVKNGFGGAGGWSLVLPASKNSPDID
jgi:putative DNA primase/helicase